MGTESLFSTSELTASFASLFDTMLRLHCSHIAAARPRGPRRVAERTRRRSVAVGASTSTAQPGQYGYPGFADECEENFPDKGVANVEEAVCLMKDLGYTWVDVRSTPERDEGFVPTSVHIALIDGKRIWNSELNDRELIQKPNREFLAEVEKRTKGDKDFKLLLGCSDGRDRAIQALELLDDAGYTNIVGVKGGYNVFLKVFDNKFHRRIYDHLVEAYGGDGRDTCGIHGTGAFNDRASRVDAIEIRPTKDSTEWLVYEEALEEVAA